MLLIRLTPVEALALQLAGDCPRGHEQQTIEIVLASKNMDTATISTLAPIYAEAAQRARAIVENARAYEITVEDETDE